MQHILEALLGQGCIRRDRHRSSYLRSSKNANSHYVGVLSHILEIGNFEFPNILEMMVSAATGLHYPWIF